MYLLVIIFNMYVWMKFFEFVSEYFNIRMCSCFHKNRFVSKEIIGRDFDDIILNLNRIIGEISFPDFYKVYPSEKTIEIPFVSPGCYNGVDYINKDILYCKSMFERRDKLISFFVDICNCIFDLHDLGFMHLNLKPESFVYHTKKKRWILASCVFIYETLTFEKSQFESLKYSRTFSAPEIRDSDHARTSSDVYSLAKIITKCFRTCKVPTPEYISDILMDCLDNDSTKRPSLIKLIVKLSELNNPSTY